MGGWKRMFKSSKGVAALIALQTVIGVQFLGWDPETVRTVSVSVVTLMGLYIAATGYEDGKKGHQERYNHEVYYDDSNNGGTKGPVGFTNKEETKDGN